MKQNIMIILLPLLLPILAQANVHGYNYANPGRVIGAVRTRTNADHGDIQQIAKILQPHSFNVDVHKDIFSFSPPDSELRDDVVDFPALGSSLKKRVKIIFIRSPDLTQDLTMTLAKLAAAKSEQRTVIYVLKKQTDLSDLTNKLQQLKQENPHRPEVYFVKYHNDAEAAEALRSIQGKYDSLGGTTRQHSSQFAPILNFGGIRRKH